MSIEKEKNSSAEVPKEIIVQENQVVKFDPEKEVENAQRAAKALMKVIDATKPLTMNGKRYLYFEHWQTIARFFNCTVGTIEVIKLENGYEAKAVVYQNGQIIGGAEASCLKDEKNWSNKPDFQLRSMAQTRAMAKALRSIFGYIAVLAGMEATPAEEAEGMVSQTQKTIEPDPTMSNGLNTGKKEVKATIKQLGFIKGLLEKKGVKTVDIEGYAFKEEDLQKLSISQAKKVIDILMQMPDEPIIQVEDQE